ncbi:MAG TPA: hypothetical protein VG122_26190 [Gemmata sp.]|jgi:hypothetical protein|nr:hypothetical protein [Gemmata sp.]
MVAAGEHVRAVGWLHPDHPFSTGPVPIAFLSRLKLFVSMSGESAKALFFGGFGGFHTCEFCGRAHGSANFGVPADSLLYVAPEMIVHYIEQHDYQPPDQFVNAVMRSPLPDSEEYQLITEPFWHIHKGAINRIIRERDAADKK